MNLPKISAACGRAFALTMALFTILPVFGEQTVIDLSADDQRRLGIRFDNAEANSAATGFQVPALVIDSPEQPSQIVTFVSGILSRWYINGGQSVRQGQIIAQLNSPELMVLQEQWLAAHNHLQDMNQQLNKDKQLLAEGVISEQRLQQTQRDHRQAEFTLQARRQQLYQAGITDVDLTALLNGELAPGAYFLRSPNAGVLSRQSVAVGDRVSAHHPLATVTDTGSLWLRAQLPLALATQVEPGDSLRIANSDAALTLISKNAALRPSTQQVEVLARFDQINALYPGQQVSLVVPVNRRGFKIPASAITHTGNATVIYVKGPDGIEARELELIPLGADYLAIDGLRSEEQLVVQGSAQLKGIQLGLGGSE